METTIIIKFKGCTIICDGVMQTVTFINGLLGESQTMSMDSAIELIEGIRRGEN